MIIFGFYVSNWLLYMFIFLTSAYIFYTWKFDVLKKLGIPHPKPWPFIGSIGYLINHGISFFESDMEKEFGKVFGWYESRNPIISTTDPDILRHILIKEFPNFTDRRFFYFRGKLMHAVFEERGQHWRGMRNLLTPAFSSGKLKHMMTPMQNSVNNLVMQIDDLIIKKDGTMETKESAASFTMDVIAAAAFGVELDCSKDPKNTFATMGKRYFDINIWGLPLMLAVYFDWLCPLVNQLFKLNMFDQKAEDYFTKMIQEAIKTRKQSTEQRNDFLGMVLDAEKSKGTIDEDDKKDMEVIPSSKLKELTEEEITGNALLFFAAGFETTATTLGFLLYFLSVNEDIQERLRQEIIDIAGDKQTSYEVLSKIEYLEMCIYETLRYCPPVPRVDRHCNNDIQIAEMFIPKGSIVSIPIHAMHRNPDIWPEPFKWDPNRFSSEEKAKRDSMYFMPFGLGPRQCIGKHLALLELKMAICDLLRKYRFVKTPETPVPLPLKKDAVLCVSEKPLIIKVENL